MLFVVCAITGEIRYKTVQYGSKLYQQGTRFGFTAFAICLGSSYFQVCMSLSLFTRLSLHLCAPCVLSLPPG